MKERKNKCVDRKEEDEESRIKNRDEQMQEFERGNF